MKQIICKAREIYRTFRHLAPISGHNFEEIENTPEKQILKCMVCGVEETGYF